jgi:site-specific recombinase XerD
MADSLSHLADWYTWLRLTYAVETAEGYWGAAWRFLRASPMPLERYSERDATLWLESLPPRSASRMLGYHALHSLFAWALRQGIVETNPVAFLKPRPPEEKVAESLSIAEVDAIIAAAHQRSPARGFAAELLYYAGGRITETRMLTWDSLTDEGLRFSGTKGNQERIVPWSDGLRHAVDGLRLYFSEQPYLIPRSEQTIGIWLKEAAAAAGIERRVHPHLFRSTNITHMLRGGARQKAVQSIAGHKNLRTTSRYVADDEEDNRAAVAILDRRPATG